MQDPNSTVRQSANIILIVAGTALILLVPLIAMQFTDEVNWTIGDFAAAGALLLGAGFALDLVVRKASTTGWRLAGGAAVLAVLAFVWAQLAVGVFGD